MARRVALLRDVVDYRAQIMVPELRAATRLLLAALVAVMVVLVVPAAAQAAVPMCGEHAQSVVAPPTILPSKGHVLDRIPCPDRGVFELGTGPSDGPRPSSPVIDDAPLRARPSGFLIPSAPRGGRLEVAEGVLRPTSGFVTSLERPPRAR